MEDIRLDGRIILKAVTEKCTKQVVAFHVRINSQLQNVMVEWLAFPLGTREIPITNFRQKTSYPDRLVVIFLSFRADTG